MKNKIEDLRNHLFETIEALKDKEKPMELDRAKAISEVAQTIINTAKVEVDFLKHVGSVAGGTGFIPLPEKVVTQEPGQPRLVKGSSQSGSK